MEGLTGTVMIITLVTSICQSKLLDDDDFKDSKLKLDFTQSPLAAKRGSVENRLISDLMTNYSRFGRPISDVNQPVEVTIKFYLTQLMSLEEKHQILTTFGWLATTWQDEYLVWNASEYAGLDELVLSPELVWLPDFGIENSAKAIYDELFYKRFRVSVTSEGKVTWMPGGKLVTSCQLDITYYPFDQQVCHLDLVDWAYHGLQVALQNGSSEVGLDSYRESGEWAITRTEASCSDNYYHSDPGVPFPRVRFTIYIKRKPMFYTINIITPCITMSFLAVLVFYLPPDSGHCALITSNTVLVFTCLLIQVMSPYFIITPCITMSFLAVLVFYLPPDSGEKVALGITVLLSFSVFLLLVAENVPKTSEYVPLIGIYLTFIMSMTAMSILICVIILNIHHRDPSAPVPWWLRRLTYNILAPVLCMRTYVRAHQNKTGKCSFMEENSNHISENVTMQSESHDCRRREENHTSSSRNHPDPMDERGVCNHINYFTTVIVNQATRDMVEEILQHIRQITYKLHEDDEEGLLRADWQVVANILDRFFLVMFIILNVVSTSVLLFFYPMWNSFIAMWND